MTLQRLETVVAGKKTVLKVGKEQWEVELVASKRDKRFVPIKEAIDDIFEQSKSSGFTRHNLVHGNCTTFAEMLQTIVGGKILHITRQIEAPYKFHAVVFWGNKYYDAWDTKGSSKLSDMHYLKIKASTKPKRLK